MAAHLVERMCIETQGQGDPLVMIHGLGGTSNVFTPQTALLAGRMRVIRPDLPGSGRSPTSGHYTVEMLADAVIRALAALGVERANFAGHSMGAAICCHIVLKQPGLVKTLALFDPLPAPADANRQVLRDRAHLARSDGMQPIADAIVESSTAGRTRRDHPVTLTLIREMIMRQDAEGYARACEALADAVAPDVRPIRSPTLLVTGEDDPVAPPSAVSELAARIPGARVRVLRECGHWSTLEQPRETGECLRQLYFGRA
jgi:3-oxoadipate enol-lactonase